MAKTLSDAMANLLASPRVLSEQIHGVVYWSQATVALTAGLADGHILPLFRLPAQTRSLALFLSYPGGGNDGYDMGLYHSGDWLQADQQVLSAAAIIDELALLGTTISGGLVGAWSGSDQPGVPAGIASFGVPFWQAAGLPSAPRAGTTYDVCMTKTTGTSVAGSLVVGLQYVVGA